MAEYPIDESKFIFTYPVFFLVDPRPPVAVMHCPVGDGGCGVHVFTDEPAAEEFLSASPREPGIRKMPVPTQAQFAEKLSILAESRFTHVVIDDRAGGRGYKRCIPIKDLLEHFKENPQ